MPWYRAPGICTIDVNPGEAADNARFFCLVPTPELGKQARASSSPPMTPEHRSPGVMQRCFVDMVRRASLCHSPNSEGCSSPPGGGSTEMPWSPCPASPIARPRGERSLSPIVPLHEPGCVDDPGFEFFAPWPREVTRALCSRGGAVSSSSCAVPPKRQPGVLRQNVMPAMPQMHGARSGEDRQPRAPSRVQQQILKGKGVPPVLQRRPWPPSSAAKENLLPTGSWPKGLASARTASHRSGPLAGTQHVHSN